MNKPMNNMNNLENNLKKYSGSFSANNGHKERLFSALITGQEAREKKHKKRLIEYFTASVSVVSVGAAVAVYLFVVSAPLLTPSDIFAKAEAYVATQKASGDIYYTENTIESIYEFNGKVLSVTQSINRWKNMKTGDYRQKIFYDGHPVADEAMIGSELYSCFESCGFETDPNKLYGEEKMQLINEFSAYYEEHGSVDALPDGGPEQDEFFRLMGDIGNLENLDATKRHEFFEKLRTTPGTEYVGVVDWSGYEAHLVRVEYAKTLYQLHFATTDFRFLGEEYEVDLPGDMKSKSKIVTTKESYGNDSSMITTDGLESNDAYYERMYGVPSF